MRACSYEFCNGVRQCAKRIHMEDWERIFAIVHTALRENDGYEMDARRAKKREGCRFGKELRYVVSI